MDYKEIVEMWDVIDDLIKKTIIRIAEYAGHLEENDEWLGDRMYDDGIIADSRENIIAFLERHGYEFEYPDYGDEE